MATAPEDGGMNTEEKFLQSLNDVKDLIGDLKSQGSATAGELDKLKERIQKAESDSEAAKKAYEARLEQLEAAKNRVDLSDDEPQYKGLAQQIMESSDFKKYYDPIKEAVENNRTPKIGRSEPIALKGLLGLVVVSELQRRQKNRHGLAGVKGLTTGSDGLGGGLVDPFRMQGLAESPTRMLTLFEAIPLLRTTTGLIEYVQETAFHELMTEVTATAAAAQKVITVDNTRGFYVEQTIEIDPQGSNREEHVVAALDHDNKTITTTTNLANTHAAKIKVTSKTFVATPEAALKPNADLVTKLIRTATRMLAHGINVSRQMVRDAENLMSYLERRLPIGLFTNAERMVISGDDSNEQLGGFLRAASGDWPGISEYNWSSGVDGDNMLDAIVRGANVATLSNFPSSHFVIHPSDLTKIRLKKGNDGHYIDIGRLAEWNLTPITTTAIEPGTAIVGSFDMGCTLWQSDEASVQIFDQHKDMAATNQMYVRSEMGVGLSIELPAGFVKVTFDSQP